MSGSQSQRMARLLIGQEQDMAPGLIGNAPTMADAVGFNIGAYRDWSARQTADGVARGLNDPETGWPTQAGYKDAANQVAMALLGGTVAPKSIPARISGYAEKMGYSVAKDSSKLSGSEYLDLRHDKLPDTNLKVRISDHDLPPSYGQPGDYDVHNGTPRDLSVDWTQVVKDLAGKVGVPVPGPVAAVLTRQERAEAARLAAEAEAATARAAATAAARANAPITSAEGQRQLLQKTFPEEWTAIHKYSDGNSNARRRELAAKYEAQNPGQVPWMRSWDPR